MRETNNTMNKELECLKSLKEFYILSGIEPENEPYSYDNPDFSTDHCYFFLRLNSKNALKKRLFTNKIFLIEYFLPMYFTTFYEYFDPDESYLPQIIKNFSRVDFDKEFVTDLFNFSSLHPFIHRNYAFYVDKDSALASVQLIG